MNPQHYSRMKELFINARELPDSKRSAFLKRKCKGDSQLLKDVQRLLDADKQDEGLLVTGADTCRKTIDIPKHIAHYEIIEVLGEGGMGVVYRAKQTQPMVRTVALKLIRPGMDSEQMVARFKLERQALALLDHPCIAHVYEGGVTSPQQGSRLYFAMELVEGSPITTYCDKHRLKAVDRLEMFLRVCDAVHHAHQRGIIHRDLKPSNIIVVDSDEGGQPKVIDFGVAKAITADFIGRTMYSVPGQLLGTPEYMSPEQANFSDSEIDTRADVYALGVLLYELLTGYLPFDGSRLRHAG